MTQKLSFQSRDAPFMFNLPYETVSEQVFKLNTQENRNNTSYIYLLSATFKSKKDINIIFFMVFYDIGTLHYWIYVVLTKHFIDKQRFKVALEILKCGIRKRVVDFEKLVECRIWIEQKNGQFPNHSSVQDTSDEFRQEFLEKLDEIERNQHIASLHDILPKTFSVFGRKFEKQEKQLKNELFYTEIEKSSFLEYRKEKNQSQISTVEPNNKTQINNLNDIEQNDLKNLFFSGIERNNDLSERKHIQMILNSENVMSYDTKKSIEEKNIVETVQNLTNEHELGAKLEQSNTKIGDSRKEKPKWIETDSEFLILSNVTIHELNLLLSHDNDFETLVSQPEEDSKCIIEKLSKDIAATVNVKRQHIDILNHSLEKTKGNHFENLEAVDFLSCGSKEEILSCGSKEEILSCGSKEEILSCGSKEEILSCGSKEGMVLQTNNSFDEKLGTPPYFIVNDNESRTEHEQQDSVTSGENEIIFNPEQISEINQKIKLINEDESFLFVPEDALKEKIKSQDDNHDNTIKEFDTKTDNSEQNIDIGLTFIINNKEFKVIGLEINGFKAEEILTKDKYFFTKRLINLDNQDSETLQFFSVQPEKCKILDKEYHFWPLSNIYRHFKLANIDILSYFILQILCMIEKLLENDQFFALELEDFFVKDTGSHLIVKILPTVIFKNLINDKHIQIEMFAQWLMVIGLKDFDLRELITKLKQRISLMNIRKIVAKHHEILKEKLQKVSEPPQI